MTNEAKATLVNMLEAYSPLIPEARRTAFICDLAALAGVCVESGAREWQAKMEKLLPEMLKGKSF